VKVGLTATIFPKMSEVMLGVAARPFRSLLETATGLTGQVVQAGDARDLADKLKGDKVQLGVFQGIEFAWARQLNSKLQPLVLCVNEERTVSAHLIVRSKSTFKTSEDLRGKALTLAIETREHCNAFLERKCVPAKNTPATFFGKVGKSDNVEEALDAVVNGEAQATVVDGLAWAWYREEKPVGAARLRVLLASEAFPCGIIACQTGRFEAPRVKRFRDGLIAAKNTPRGKQLLRFLRLTGFETIPASYDRLLAAVAKAYPPPPVK
jgi:ABC-type phosphate/phosphonate transport system substrate-binding protein